MGSVCKHSEAQEKSGKEEVRGKRDGREVGKKEKEGESESD